MELKSDNVVLELPPHALLIVPYGIEIVEIRHQGGIRVFLLIVPYGIEISEMMKVAETPVSFNCTLWN